MISLIRSEHLDRWASRITAVPEFPRLVRLLVHATARELKQVNFPADEAVRLAGWDGIVVAEVAAPNVPEGLSVWELGTGHDPRKKANDDYTKRSSDPLNVDPLEATFVFATPRRWPGRNDWVTEKRAEGKWKDVIACDAEVFAQWLESAPAVAAWLAPMVGIAPPDARALEEYCGAYRAATKPALDLPGLLIGRDSERANLLAFLQGPPRSIEISATTVTEAAAFVGACIDSLPERERESFWARAICLEARTGLRAIEVSDRSLIVVAPGELLVGGTNHHFVHTCTSHGGGGGDAIELGAQPISALAEHLAQQGLDRNDAYERSQEAGGYLERVRHTLFAVAPGIPDWAAPVVGVNVAASILVGEWDESNKADIAIVAAIAGVDYEHFLRAITPYQSGPRPLVSRAGTVWRVYARQKAWKLLEPFLTPRELSEFLQAACDVLLEPDPRFDLVPEERWMSNVHGKCRVHSSHLRGGLAGGLLHAAILGRDDSACYAGCRPQDRISGACRRLFLERGEPGFWRRIRGELQELAEASPNEFLAALEADLEQSQPQICELFEEEGDIGECLHAKLLWALELLAWVPECLGRAAVALAALAERDPGGRWANRPHRSLTQLLLPWKPQCSATTAQRKELFVLITKRFPKVGWELGASLMPNQTGYIMPSARPKLRTGAPGMERKPRLAADYLAEIQDISERLLELSGDEPERWYFLLSRLNSLTPVLRERVLCGADNLVCKIGGDARLSFWMLLRKLLHQHNQFSLRENAKWVYPREILDRLENLYATLAPEAPIARLAWLFSYQVERPTDVALDWREENERTRAAQSEAAEVLVDVDLSDLIAELPRFENHRLLGYCLGRSSRAHAIERELFGRCAASMNERERELVRGFSAARYEADPRVFLRQWCSKASPEFLSDQAVATMLQGLPASPEVWDVVDAAGSLCHDAFWRQDRIHLFDHPREAERAARSLLSVGRALVAIELLAANASSDWLSTDGDVQLVYDVLAAGVGEANANPAHGRSTSYNIAYLIKALADSKRLGSGKLVHLEWSYFGMLEHQAQHDLVIYQQLISDPELLLELLALIYKPEGETRECFPEPSATERAVATHSWRILNEWKPFACASPDSMPQAGALLDFVGRVREKAAEWHHTRVADYHLGVAMASAPAGTDGVWPHESVREVLERYHSESLADGFVVGRANLVGITSRAPGDGGEQERGDAVQYEAWQRALAARNPRTSSLLGRLAEDRRAEATWEDAQDRIR